MPRVALNDFAARIEGADAVEFWLVGGAVAALVATAFYFGFAYLKRKRVLEDTPTALIRSAPQGYVELTGHAELMDGEPILAPLTGRPCTWYRYKVEQKRRSADGKNTSWHIVDTGVSEALFHIVDTTGKCVIDPEGADVITTHKDTWYGRSRYAGPGRSGFGMSMTSKYRFSERRIHHGDPLYAIGNYETRGGAATTFDKETEVRELVREWKRDRATMLQRFDSDGDGEIDMREWQKAQAAAERTVLAERERIAVAPPVDILGATTDSRHPFVISNVPEEKLQRGYHRKSVALILAASLGAVALFWVISVRLAG